MSYISNIVTSWLILGGIGCDTVEFQLDFLVDKIINLLSDEGDFVVTKLFHLLLYLLVLYLLLL